MTKTVVDRVEVMYCMCGSVARHCPYCDKEFEEGPHRPINTPQTMVIKGGLIFTDTIPCIHCGQLTGPEHRVRRSAKEAKALRKKTDNE